jgi:hypothetical protein
VLSFWEVFSQSWLTGFPHRRASWKIMESHEMVKMLFHGLKIIEFDVF